MNTYSLSHLSDGTLLRGLAVLVARDRATTAELLAHIAEVDARRLYRPAAYPSMYAYCVHELRFSEEAAFKRIHAARAARRVPEVLKAVADGRLHLSAVVLLAPHLTRETAGELLAAAAHKTKAEIERLLAERFPRPDVPTRVQALSSPAVSTPLSFPGGQHAPGRVETGLELAGIPNVQHTPGRVETSPELAGNPGMQHAPGRVETGLELAGNPNAQHAPGRVETSPELAGIPGMQHAPGRVETILRPLSSERVAVQFTCSRSAHDKLRYAQSLLSHQFPSGDVGDVFERALDALIAQLEKRKFAAVSKPRSNQQAVATTKPQPCPGSYPGSRRGTSSARHIPAHVKRAVWARDQGRCTFTSDKGQRCPARRLLEFDHVDEVARGGRASIGLIQLRCRAHNQYTAEQTYGPEFMNHKRDEARRQAERSRAERAMGAATHSAMLPSPEGDI